jgi:hypothetical protein
MSTTAKFKIQTRNQNNNLHTAWTTDGIGDQNEFDSAAEARVCVRMLRSYGDSWTESEYRLVGPQGIESAEMDGPSWQYAIDMQLARLGLSDASNGRSAIACNIDDDGKVMLSDNAADWCRDADAEAVCDILEGMSRHSSIEDMRDMLAELSGL